MINLSIIPFDGRELLDFDKNREFYDFTWKLVYFRWNFMYIQLNFTNPGYISSQSNLDTLDLRVVKEYGHMYYSKEVDEFLDKGWYNLTHTIPRQIVDE